MFSIIIFIINIIIMIIIEHMSLCYYTTMPPGVASLEDILASRFCETNGVSLFASGSQCCKSSAYGRYVRAFLKIPAAQGLQRLSDNSLSLLLLI